MEIGASYSFSAAMSLPDYEGNCKTKHGYCFELTVTSTVATAAQLDLDVVQLDQWIESNVVSRLNRVDLNSVIEYPSLEGTLLWIAALIFQQFDQVSALRLTAANRYFAQLSRHQWELYESN